METTTKIKCGYFSSNPELIDSGEEMIRKMMADHGRI